MAASITCIAAAQRAPDTMSVTAVSAKSLMLASITPPPSHPTVIDDRCTFSKQRAKLSDVLLSQMHEGNCVCLAVEYSPEHVNLTVGRNNYVIADDSAPAAGFRASCLSAQSVNTPLQLVIAVVAGSKTTELYRLFLPMATLN